MEKLPTTISIIVAILTISLISSAHVVYDVNATHFPQHVRINDIQANYTPEGHEFNLESRNITIYETTTVKNPERVLIGVYDIFGFSSDNVKQVSDRISEQNGNFTVVLPDFYRGESWDRNNTRPR